MLTAALLRSLQRPARVVVGVALVADATRYGAYGHAWTELLDEGRWVVADAALHGTDGVRYIPYGVLTDEGPGYALGLARLSSVWLQRLVVLGPAAPR